MKQKDKQNISQLEKKLKAEQEARSFVEKQLMEEKKRKKLEEATAARAVAFAAASRYVCVPRALPLRLACLAARQAWGFEALGRIGIERSCRDRWPPSTVAWAGQAPSVQLALSRNGFVLWRPHRWSGRRDSPWFPHPGAKCCL